MVAEADESDRSFLKLTPTIAVVTNIDREHLDTYRDLADVQDAFVGFLNKVPFYGACVLCLDDPPVQDVLPRVERRVVSYGLCPAGPRLGPRPRARPDGLELHRRSSTASRSGRSRSRCPAPTTWRTRSPRWRSVSTSALAFTAIRAGLESFTRRRPALPDARRGRRRPGDRRLRAPPDGDPRDARGAAPPRRLAPHGRALPAAPLHAHAGAVGRVLQGLPPGGRAAADATSTRPPRSRSPGSRPRRWRRRSPSAATGRWRGSGDLKAATRAARGGGARGRRGAHARRGERVDGGRGAPAQAGRLMPWTRE